MIKGHVDVKYSDGTEATMEQEIIDLVSFLTWTAQPELNDRKSMGFRVFLLRQRKPGAMGVSNALRVTWRRTGRPHAERSCARWAVQRNPTGKGTVCDVATYAYWSAMQSTAGREAEAVISGAS